MKVNLIAAESTRPETIDKLLQEVPDVFPGTIELVDSGLRYAVRRDNVVEYDPGLPLDEVRSADGVMLDGIYRFNLAKAVRDVRPEGEHSFVVSHWPFIMIGKGEEMDAFFPGGCEMPSYENALISAGLCSQPQKLCVAVMPNMPEDDNSKVAAHEIGHFTLRTHCPEYAGELRCIMNPPEQALRRQTDWAMEFCKSCYDQLSGAIPLIEREVRVVVRLVERPEKPTQ